MVPVLPHQLLHGDLHLGHLLWDTEVCGILDFDDMGYGPRVLELAVLLADLHQRDMVGLTTGSVADVSALAAPLVDGYSEHLELLVAVRLFAELGSAASRPVLEWSRAILECWPDRIGRIERLLERSEPSRHGLQH
jgi:Ser/Thr protein kinase RdoA (MazF antagonist)